MATSLRWKNTIEVRDEINKKYNLDMIKKLYTLRCFWSGAFLPSDYTPTDTWIEAIRLSEYGQTIFNEYLQEFEALETPIMKFCLFRIFSYHDLLLSIEECNSSNIAKQLEKDTISGIIYFPYRFGRLLYDKYNDEYLGERLNHLPESDVLKLIKNTPIGVYQLYNTIIGPLGIIKSNEERYLPPSLKLPLWHCSDTGCRAIHHVRLLNEGSPIHILTHKILDRLNDVLGQRSEWNHALFIKCFRNYERGLGFKYRDMAALLGDCITIKEKKVILEDILKSKKSTEFREILSNTYSGKEISKGSPTEIINRFSEEECFQLLLTQTDTDLIDIIERCIDHKLIRLPIGQIRIAKNIPYLPSLSSVTEMSCFGLRSTNEEPAVELMRMIEQIYAECNKINELNWLLKSNPDNSTSVALYNYLQKFGPEDTVKTIILTHPEVCKRFATKLNISISPIDDSDLFINRLLWRLNFEPISPDSSLKRFVDRIRVFQNTLMKTNEPLNERMREEIRAAGVNLFVSVEEFLEKVLTYSTWLLASDHFLDTRCIFDIVDARSTVAKVLGSTLESHGQQISWNSEGTNTLGVLLHYFSEATTWMSSLIEADRALIKHTKADLPFYVDRKAQVFLFQHTQLWADIDKKLLSEISMQFTSIAKLVAQSNLTAVRNGIDHMRTDDDFPGIDSMIACASRLEQAVIQADINRFFPKPFWLVKHSQNRDGLTEYQFVDAKRDLITVTGPAMFCGGLNPNFGRLWLISPLRMCESPNSTLVLRYQESNEYEQYWKGYPRRKFVPPKGSESVINDEYCLHNTNDQ